MLVQRTFADGGLNLTLEVFLGELYSVLGPRLLSVMLHGSVVHGDLAPGCGDLDFVGVIDRDVAEDISRALVALRKPLRSGSYGELARMLEGAFLPRPMLSPGVTGSGFWWGTTGERSIDRNHLGWFNLLDLRQNGAVIFGYDLRTEIPLPGHHELLREIRDMCRSIRKNGEGGQPYAVDWLLQSARFLAFLSEQRLFTKSEAAEWAATHASGAWREHLGTCSRYRKDAAFRDQPGTRRWLESLSQPIQEACDEVEHALSSRGEG